MTRAELIQLAAGFIGSLGFALLFNIRGKRLIFASLGGIFSWTLFLLLGNLTGNEPARYFAVALCAAVYAEIMARILKTPTTTFVIISLVPLIPGSSLYYTMSYAIEKDGAAFLARALYTLQLAAALALGVITTAMLTKIVTGVAAKIKAAHKGSPV